MFRLHKRQSKSGERVDFKFSHFKATQVPKGWDKLYVSLISVETGKTIGKLNKALVRNGACQWTETLSESIWVSLQDDNKLEDCHFKLVVAMGSTRSSVLGEVTVNMTEYISSSATVPISVPLKKCNHGTVLQAKIQCLTPRSKLRQNEESNDSTPLKEDPNAGSQDMDMKSEGSDSIFARSTESSSSKDLGLDSNQGQPGNVEGSHSTSGSQHSSDESIERAGFSPTNNISSGDERSRITRQDSASSQNSVAQGTYHADDPVQSNSASFNSKSMGSGGTDSHNQQELSNLSLRMSNSNKDLLEAAEDTIEQLRAEAKMWERNARKLMIDLETLRIEFSNQSKNQVNLDVELSATCAERDGLRKEVAELRKVSSEKQAASKEPTFHDNGVGHIRKELEDEIKFQKESNANLAKQLDRSQEANIELVSVLQELEETIEKQKEEMESLSTVQERFKEMEDSIQARMLENQNLKLQIEQLRESESNLHKEDTETEYKTKLSAKEKEIASLKAKLSESLKERRIADAALNGDHENLIREIESLKEKLHELERDCNELTDENLSLLFKLKEAKNGEVNDNELQLPALEEKLKKKVLGEIHVDYDISIQQLEVLKLELEAKVTELGTELAEKNAQVDRLEATMLSKEEEIRDLQRCCRELVAKVSKIEQEKLQLEDNMQIIKRESDLATKCLNDMQNDMMALSSSVSSHVTVNKTLARKSSELESGKHELALRLAELEEGNRQLSEFNSDLEEQLKNVTAEKELSKLELQNSRDLVSTLQDELNEMETGMEDVNQQLQDMCNQLSDAQSECEVLRRDKAKLQEAAEILIEECNSLQKSKEEFKKQISESQEYSANLECRLAESDKNTSELLKRVEHLEENMSSMLEEFRSKEKCLSSEINKIFDENQNHKENLLLAQNQLNHMYLEKTREVENLQADVENLSKQLSVANDERERISSDSRLEVAELLEEKAKLESSLQQFESKLKLTESELNSLRMEAEKKAQSLMDELDNSKQHQEMLMAGHEKVLNLLEEYKSREDKLKTRLNGLELKLTVAEYESQQLKEESTNLKAKLLKTENLEDELLAFKNDFIAIKFEKEKLEASLQVVNRECDSLKAEKILLQEKISSFEKVVNELEDCRHYSADVEKRLEQMETDRAELRNELDLIRTENRQIQNQVQILEEEKNESLTRAQALEEELRSTKVEKHEQKESNGYRNRRQRKDDELENEVPKALEANNNKYKVQHKRHLTDGRNNGKNSPRKQATDTEFVPKEKFEKTKSLLESELKDLRERYLSMSLKYAEVEAEREQLVMKFKTAKNGKWWFS